MCMMVGVCTYRFDGDVRFFFYIYINIQILKFVVSGRRWWLCVHVGKEKKQKSHVS